MSEKPRVRGYVDGFNLYKGALEGSAHKWLDLAALCDRLAGSSVDLVAYCTAPLVALPGDPGVVMRQQVYLRALGGNPRRGNHAYTRSPKSAANAAVCRQVARSAPAAPVKPSRS